MGGCAEIHGHPAPVAVADLRPGLMQGFNDIEATAISKAKVNHGERRGCTVHMGDAFRNGFCRQNLEAARFHGACLPRQEWLVIIDEEQRLFVGECGLCH